MIALIDADIVGYRCAASAEGYRVEEALFRLDELMDRILFNTNASEYKAFLTGSNNFRKQIYPLYKANRTAPKPVHLQACREHLVSEWKATVVNGCEADDALGWSQASDTVICSNDKDLRQIPGNHFNFVKQDWTQIDEYTGWYNFYRQFLEGDKSDNIEGIRGIGPKKAEGILFGLTEEEMFDRVRELYNNDERMHLNGKLLYIWRKENDQWKSDILEEATKQKSLTKTTTDLSEPTSMNSEDGFLSDGTVKESSEKINPVT